MALLDHYQPRLPRHPGEQRRFRPGHPHLSAARRQPVEQCGTTQGVKMGSQLVEQQDRAAAARARDQVAVTEHQRQQQRLLFAGRTASRRLLLGTVGDAEVVAVRPRRHAMSPA